jgi:hypothetical protein
MEWRHERVSSLKIGTEVHPCVQGQYITPTSLAHLSERNHHVIPSICGKNNGRSASIPDFPSRQLDIVNTSSCIFCMEHHTTT